MTGSCNMNINKHAGTIYALQPPGQKQHGTSTGLAYCSAAILPPRFSADARTLLVAFGCGRASLLKTCKTNIPDLDRRCVVCESRQQQRRELRKCLPVQRTDPRHVMCCGSCAGATDLASKEVTITEAASSCGPPEPWSVWRRFCQAETGQS